MDDTTSPSSCEWHVIAEFEAVDCFWEDFEVTRNLLNVDEDKWKIHWFSLQDNLANGDITFHSKENGGNVTSDSDAHAPYGSITPKSIVNIINSLSQYSSKLPCVLWFLYDYDHGAFLIEKLESTLHASPSSWSLLCPPSRSYDISSSKTAMKQEFVAHGVSTAPWTTHPLPEHAFSGSWFIKPDCGAASVGQLIDNRVYDASSMEKVDALGNGVIAEHFIAGRECTILISGPCSDPTLYPAVERVFTLGVDGFQIDDVWDNFHFETIDPTDPFYESSQKLARAAYSAIGCAPYARIDIRGDYVLEVNAVPGYSLVHLKYSMAAILQNNPELWKKFWDSVWNAKRILKISC